MIPKSVYTLSVGSLNSEALLVTVHLTLEGAKQEALKHTGGVTPKWQRPRNSKSIWWAIDTDLWIEREPLKP